MGWRRARGRIRAPVVELWGPSHMIKLMQFLAGALVIASCAPAIAPCGPASCEGGCCDSRGVCVAGRTKTICGVGGAMCSSCEGALQCVAGACVMPPMDAGVDVDAGVPDAGEAPLDAGQLRTVRVRRTDEALLPDGGVRVTQFNLATAVNQRLLYEDGTGEWIEVMPTESGLELRYDGIPVGPYVLARGFEYVVSDADDFELGARTLGKRDRVISGLNTTLSLELQAVPRGARGDVIGVTSFGSGTTADFLRLPPPNDAGTSTATTDLVTAVQPFGMSGADGDELTAVLRRNVSDGGPVWSAAIASGTVTAPELASQQTAMTTVTLTPLAQELHPVTVRSSDFEQFAAEVHPNAVPASTQASVSSFLAPPRRPTTGGDFVGQSMLLASSLLLSGRGDLSAPLTFGRPFGDAPLLVEGRLTVTVPLALSGRSLNRSVDALLTTRADGGVLDVTLTPPRFVRINGESATINRAGVGLTPVLEWAQPALGTPGSFVVTILKVTPQGTTLNESFAAQIRTPFSRLKVPPFALARGEAYFALISAITTTGFDPRRYGFHSEREFGRATAATAIFTP